MTVCAASAHQSMRIRASALDCCTSLLIAGSRMRHVSPGQGALLAAQEHRWQNGTSGRSRGRIESTTVQGEHQSIREDLRLAKTSKEREAAGRRAE